MCEWKKEVSGIFFFQRIVQRSGIDYPTRCVRSKKGELNMMRREIRVSFQRSIQVSISTVSYICMLYYIGTNYTIKSQYCKTLIYYPLF